MKFFINSRSPKMRILSAFMAFLIFSLGFLQMLGQFDWSIKAEALEITEVTKSGNYITENMVEKTKHDGHSVVKGSETDQATQHELTYRYTGNVKTTKVSLYDYKTDAEISGGSITNTYTKYGCEPFNQLNTAISNDVADSVTQQDMNKIIITYKPDSTRNTSDGVKIYLWKDDPRTADSWPPSRNMTYDNSKQCYTYTFDCNTESFVPDRVIFYFPGGISQTNDIVQPMSTNHIYAFTEGVGNNISFKMISNGSSRLHYIYLWNDSGSKSDWPGDPMTYVSYPLFTYTFDASSFVPTGLKFSKSGSSFTSTSNLSYNTIRKGYTYYYNWKDSSAGIKEIPSVTISKIYETKYENPLYFGCFYRNSQSVTSYVDNVKPVGQYFQWLNDSQNTESFQSADLSKFYWQANLGLKSKGDGSGNNSVDVRGHAAVQGLVNDTLNNEKKYTDQTEDQTTNPKVLKLTQGTGVNAVELPYFSYQFQRDNPTLMTIYDKSGTGIDFPFYEMLTDASNVRLAEDSLKVSTDQARFYQFNSEDVNLRFDTSSQTFLEETNVRIKSNNRKTGYFPFNSTNSDGVNDNLGFGTKFEMKFKLSEDGTVNTVSSTGGKSENPTKVHTMFEFLGDDDLWVFIDGNLVLDLGGTHDQSSGLIDFYTGKAYANKAITLGAGTGKDDLSAGDLSPTGGIIEKNVKDTLSANGSYDSVTGKYDPNFPHTMTIFYLERGMMDSNLMIRYNYKPESNFSKMKIQEITDFSGVNSGLRDLTKKAADNDVFRYTVSNRGTSSSDIHYTGILYPTYDTYKRKYKSDAEESMTDQLTGRDLEYDPTPRTDRTAVFLDATATWDQADAVIAAWIWKGGENGKLYLGTRVPNTDHVFQFRGYPSEADKIHFLRLKPDYKPYYSGDVGWPTDKYWNQSGDKDLKNGKQYTITGYNNSITVPSDSDADYSFKVLKYDDDNDSIFHPSTGFTDVASTNYIWVDEFASLSGTQVDDITNGFTGKTDNNGNLYLMYGSGSVNKDVNNKVSVSGIESSAEFENQFTRGSIMKVVQQNNLKAPARTSGTTEDFATAPDSGRTVNQYYSTTVEAFDRVGEAFAKSQSGDPPTTDYTLNYQKDGSNNYVTHYEFNNNTTLRTDTSMTVMMTEVFKNSVNVNSISVTKLLYPADDVQDEFEFTLTLTDIFGDTGNNVSDYTTIDIAGASSGDKLLSGGKFRIKKGDTATISGIPVGTSYTITETIPNTNYKIHSSSNPSFSGTINDTTTSYSHTFTNTRKIGTLKLKKILTTNPSGGYIPSDIKTRDYKFHVTLTAPDGVDLTTYISGLSGLSDYAHTGNDYTFTYTFTGGTGANDNVEYIVSNNVPVGTTCSIYEDMTGLPDCITSSNAGSGNPTTPLSIVADSTVTAEITNTYNYGSMTLSKQLCGEANADNVTSGNSGTEFIFKVVLTNTGLNLGDCLDTSAIEAMAMTSPAPAYNSTDHTYTFYVKVKAGETPQKTIGKIPYGTDYSVTEVGDASDVTVDITERPEVTYSNESGTINSLLTVADVSITNTYRKVTLTKKDSKDDHTLPNAKFVLLKLKRSLTPADKTALQALFASAPTTNFDTSFQTYYNDHLLTYCNGFSSIKDTNESGQIVIKSSEMSGGLTADDDYFFLELTAPANYVKNNTITGKTFTIDSTNDGTEYTYTLDYTNVRQTNNLTLEKKHTVATPASEGDTLFTYTVTLNKPDDVTDLREFVTTSYLESIGATVASSGTDTIVFTIPVSKNTSKTIAGLPNGTKYSISESNPSADANWVNISTLNSNISNSTGITSDTTAYFTNAKTSSLTITKHLAAAPGETIPANCSEAVFSFTVVLENNDIDLSNCTLAYSGTGYTGTPSLTVDSANGLTISNIQVTGVDSGTDKTAVISGIPYGTSYTVTEDSPLLSGWAVSYDTNKIGTINSSSATTVTNVKDKKISGKVILTKTAKEQVGTIKIGDTLAGAQFILRYANGTTVTGFTGTYTTNAEGKLTIEGLAPGDYYLEEQTAPDGYSKTDSNTNADRRVYFSIGVNTTVKNITCSDEMDPAYLMLYEHIDEKIDAWGDPTFIFKITQTKYADDTDVPAASQRTHIVALTVDENGKWTAGLQTGQNNETYNNTTDDSKSWLEESTAEPEYKGMYHIDSQGRIRLEPGTYSITRVPVSRYKFVENTWKLSEGDDSDYVTYRTTTEALTVTIPATKTAIVHYYDKVAYYDKFTHVDTEVNKMYQLDQNKKNITAKGIRVVYNAKADITGSSAVIDISSSSDFKAYFINVDGSEREMSSEEKQRLIIKDTDPTYKIGTDFTFDENNHTITVENNAAKAGNVYVLQAVYKENSTEIFTTEFELVFETT